MFLGRCTAAKENRLPTFRPPAKDTLTSMVSPLSGVIPEVRQRMSNRDS
jgi:hypothetical protein